jgi:hypothetical protein
MDSEALEEEAWEGLPSWEQSLSLSWVKSRLRVRDLDEVKGCSN